MNFQWNNSITRRTAIGVVSVAALALSSGISQAEETIKIGGIMSMTGGGASIGKTAEVGWKLAIEDINAAGGILGKKAELVLGDTMTDPTHAVSEVRRLIENEKVQVLVGPATSQETIPVVPISGEKKVAQISSAASTQLTPEAGPFHFSGSVTGLNQMKPNIDFAIDVLKLKKLALISDNGGMSKAAVVEIVDYLKSKGVEPTAVQEFAFRTEDMTPQLFQMRSSGAEAILLINSIGDDSRKLLENRADIGWDVPVLANQTMTNYAVGNAAVVGEEAFKDVYSVQFVGMTYCPSDAVGENAFAKFVKRAKEQVADVDRMGGASALIPYYIQPVVLAAAINGSGKTDGESIAAWLQANASKVEMLTGPIQASAKSHFLPAPESIKVVKNPYKPREDGLVERADCGA
ncbi:ABC transporter substrate-binding protein [Aminobacter anthyllidis]|uniref:ABC transporter substrate-binding protein n=1 Tax=Aminobacter anthyllidis TaxID=1035067 RepID=UPI0024541FCB|nr:ABC transporter substrate-binding protein [Aminobacter anthyllidis]MDH4984720.1 ABC transporter substrate-binding protein [Aminobacter anthyllidis]